MTATAMSSSGAAVRNRGRRLRSGLRGGLAFYGFISPWLIGTAALTLFPVGYAVYLSFTDWNGMTP